MNLGRRTAGREGGIAFGRRLLVPLVSAAVVAGAWLTVHAATDRNLAEARRRLRESRLGTGASPSEAKLIQSAHWRATKMHEIVVGIPSQFAFEHNPDEWINLDRVDQERYILRFSLALWGAYGFGLGWLMVRWRSIGPRGRGSGVTALLYPPVFLLAFYLNLGGVRPGTWIYRLLRPWDTLIRWIDLPVHDGSYGMAWNTEHAMINWMLTTLIVGAGCRWLPALRTLLGGDPPPEEP